MKDIPQDNVSKYPDETDTQDLMEVMDISKYAYLQDFFNELDEIFAAGVTIFCDKLVDEK